MDKDHDKDKDKDKEGSHLPQSSYFSDRLRQYLNV